ncbi:MAG: T9SS type A sorting domain-containing protein [Bacteroidota bacterium]
MKKNLLLLIVLSLCVNLSAQQFSRKKAMKMAIKEGISPSNYEKFIEQERLKFENNGQRPVNPYHGSYTALLKKQQSAAKTASTSCNNVNLEDGNYNNWNVFTGININSLSTPTNVIVDTTATVTGLNTLSAYNSIVDNAHATDSSGIALNSPYIGNNIARVNHFGNMQHVGILERQIVVSPSDPFVNFSYTAFLENAGHMVQEQPYINIIFFDINNDTIPGTFLNVTANSNTSSANPGFSTISYSPGQQYFYKPWTPVSVDLSAYAGQTVTAQFIASDCVQGGHGGYMYIDFECNSAGTTVPNTWPGDANYDLTVNFADLFYIGAGYSLSGPPRATIDNSYNAFPSTDWAANSLYLVDAKHADCNGDGTVDLLDTAAISQNYGIAHAFKNSMTYLTAQSVNTQFPITIVPTADSVYYGQSLSLSFNLGNSITPVDSIYGLGFTLTYPDQLVDPLYTNQSCTTSLLGTYGTNLLKLAKPLGNVIDMVAVKNDHQNSVNINGNIFTLNLRANQQNVSDSVFNFSITNLRAITKTGYTIPFTNASKSIKFKANLSTGLKANHNDLISIYPNPAQNKITITSPDKIKSYQITSVLGNVVKQATSNNSGTTDIDITDLAKSTYFISIETENGHKIVKQFIKL